MEKTVSEATGDLIENKITDKITKTTSHSNACKLEMPTQTDKTSIEILR